MHASSFENMQKCYRRYVAGGPLETREKATVLDLGGADVNGSYAELFKRPNFEYVGTDIAPAPGVSLVLDDPNTLPLPDNSVDLVISGQMFEHCEFFWLVFAEMVRVLKPDGYIFLIAPSSGPIHHCPVDCYRFHPDGYSALAKYTGAHLVDMWMDRRGPWKDLVGVFAKNETTQAARASANAGLLQPNQAGDFPATRHDTTSGETSYLETLALLHRQIKPANYLEIGVRHGRSLALAHGPAVGVDPAPELTEELPPSASIVQATSDDFFEAGEHPILSTAPELVFIDGMHLFEYALRDFMHVESIAGTDTVVAIDDIYPNNARQAERDRSTRVWAGDVWKLHRVLERYRPDLSLIALDCAPTGLLLVRGLDPGNTVLWEHYNPIVREMNEMSAPPAGVIRRKDAVSPAGPHLGRWLGAPIERGSAANRQAARRSQLRLLNAEFARRMPGLHARLKPALVSVKRLLG